MLAKQFRHAGERAVGDHGDAFDLLVVFADKVHVGGESTEILPSGKGLGMNQHAVKLGVFGEIGVNLSAETAEVLLAQGRAGFEYQYAAGFHD